MRHTNFITGVKDRFLGLPTAKKLEIIEGLTEQQRFMVLQHLMFDLSFRTISDVMGIPVKRPGNTFRHAILSLHRLLEIDANKQKKESKLPVLLPGRDQETCPDLPTTTLSDSNS